MSNNIIDLKSKSKKIPEQNLPEQDLSEQNSPEKPTDNYNDTDNPNNYPTCVRLVSSNGNEERVFLPKGVHDLDKIHEYPEVVYTMLGGNLDSFNFTIEVGDVYDDH